MDTSAQLQAATQAVETARTSYNAAVANYNSSSLWERTTQALGKKVGMAKTALDEAQENYMQVAAVSMSNTGFTSVTGTTGTKSISILPIVLAVLIILAVVIYIIKKRKK